MPVEPKAGSTDVTRRIAEVVSQLRYDDLPAQVVEVAKHCLLDWLAVTIAGSREPLTAILRAEAAAECSDPACTLIGGGGKASPYWAALVNGSASHALDYDDVLAAMGGHPSVPVLPGLAALAEVAPTSGRAFITAFVAGVETERRIAAAVLPEHYNRGFHPTATLGTFGAAAACAHLLGLDLPQWRTALGLAGTQAAGLKCMFGTMAKPLHAGRASASGLLAARLASRGFSAAPDVLEAAQGFAETQTLSWQPDRALAIPAGEFAIASVLFKHHAACYLTHATIEALQQLRARYRLQPDQIDHVLVQVPAGHLRICNVQNPATGLEAKFSLRFVSAMALLGTSTDERAFDDAVVAEPQLTALRDRVSVAAEERLPSKYSSRVRVRLKGGGTIESKADVSVPVAAGHLPEQWTKLGAKFDALVTPVLGDERGGRLREEVARLEDLHDVGGLIASAGGTNAG